VGISYKDEISPTNTRIDCRNVRRREIMPSINPTRISSHRVARSSSRGCRAVDSRHVGIDQNDGGSISDFPAGSSQIFENDLIIFRRVDLILTT